VTRVVATAPALVREQVEAVLADLDVGAIKTGALGSLSNVRAVAVIAERHGDVPWVIDPVMVPTRGASRLDGGAGPRALLDLARRAALVTPNLEEAGLLLGSGPPAPEDAADAAAALVSAGCAAALVKGGHGRGAEAVDWLATPTGVVRIAMPRRRGPEVHGTGCALASLIAGRLARRSGRAAPNAREIAAVARWARGVLDGALASALAVGGGSHVVDMPRGAPLR
jgi:hydroxymethylpyrimidine/phosphomethylpyrimidine kinase